MRVVVVHHPLDVGEGEPGRYRPGRGGSGFGGRAGADLVMSGMFHLPLCRALAVRYGPSAGGAGLQLPVRRFRGRTRRGGPTGERAAHRPLSGAERRARTAGLRSTRGAFRLGATLSCPDAPHRSRFDDGDMPTAVLQVAALMAGERVQRWPATARWCIHLSAAGLLQTPSPLPAFIPDICRAWDSPSTHPR